MDLTELEDKCLELTANQTHAHRREILAQTNAAMTNREKLFRLWKSKSELLDSQRELQLFYREVGQLVASVTCQESVLAKAFGESCAQLEQGQLLRVEEVQALLKVKDRSQNKTTSCVVLCCVVFRDR